MISGLVRGDRMPDFQRPNPAGETVMLYDLQKGRPMLLLVFEEAAAPDTRAALDALARDSTDSAPTRVAMVRATPAQCAAFAKGSADGVTLLADDGAVALHLLGAETPGPRLITGFALDSNLRVIERIEHQSGGNLADFLQQLNAACKQDASRAPQIINQQAPALFIPRVMDPAMCAELVAYFEQQGGQPS
ncbi:MAG: redoxin domain-containing protein, partial [Gammaproteobacteria bacterium]|nr:redoxin domain-containing protein [Gammaproteobacteria bacterium]